MGKEAQFDTLNGGDIKVGIVAARWNEKYTYSLVEGCRESIMECGVKAENITGLFVPGAYEVPLGAKHLLDTTNVDVVIAVGCLIKGATMHFEYICESVSSGIMRLNLDYGKPVIFGVLTCLDEAQAEVRSIGEHNHGNGWGKTAVEMALLVQKKLAM